MTTPQLPIVEEKYKRRIERFYKNISKPTLFIRYISDNNELIYIENNLDSLYSVLREFNYQNEILFVANSDLKSDKIPLFTVEPDPNDSVARRFLDKNEELHNYLNEGIIYDKYARDRNSRTYKHNKKYSILFKIYNRYLKTIKKLFSTTYDHYQKI